MISLSEIQKFYPENQKGSKKNILREYLQYKILEIIFESKYAHNLVFLGGTALRIVHNINRYSEDLDFDNLGLSLEEFKDLADIVKINLEKLGYEVEINTVHKGGYRTNIRMPKLLFDNNLSKYEGEKILIQIDTVPQVFEYEKEGVLLNKFGVFTKIFVTPIDLLLAQKIYAAIERKRAKGRDFFDIVTLWAQTKPNYRYLEAKMGIKNLQELKATLIKRVDSLKLEELTDDMLPYLIDANEIKKVTLFKDFVMQL